MLYSHTEYIPPQKFLSLVSTTVHERGIRTDVGTILAREVSETLFCLERGANALTSPYSSRKIQIKKKKKCASSLAPSSLGCVFRRYHTGIILTAVVQVYRALKFGAADVLSRAM